LRQSIKRQARKLAEYGALPNVWLRNGVCYLLNTDQIVELIRTRKSRSRTAREMFCYFVDVGCGLMRGDIPSPNAEVTIALQDAAEGVERISPGLRQFFFGSIQR